MYLNNIKLEKVLLIDGSDEAKERWISTEPVSIDKIVKAKYIPKEGDILYLEGCTIPMDRFGDYCRLHGLTRAKKKSDNCVCIAGPKLVKNKFSCNTYQYIPKYVVEQSYPGYFTNYEDIEGLIISRKHGNKIKSIPQEMGSYKYICVFTDEKSVQELQKYSEYYDQNSILGDLTDIVIDMDKWRQLNKMINHTDDENKSFALSIMASCNFEKSAPYLMNLIYYSIRQSSPLKDTKNFKVIADFFGIKHPPFTLSEAISILENKNLFDKKNKDIFYLIEAEVIGVSVVTSHTKENKEIVDNEPEEELNV